MTCWSTHGHALALQHARAVVAFYEYYAHESIGYAEQQLAQNMIWWHEDTGDKIVYMGGIAHTRTNHNQRAGSGLPLRPASHTSSGSYLRDHLGSDYLSIGLTFDHGSVPYAVPAPSPEFADSVLGSAGLETYLLDLHSRQPPSVRAWLSTSAKTRVIGPSYNPENDSAYHMSGGSLAEWFDIIIQCREVTLVRFLV